MPPNTLSQFGGLFKLGNFLSPSDMSVLQTWILISNSLTLEHSPVGSRRMFSHHSSDGAYRCQTLTRLWSYNKWELCDWKYKVMWQIAIMMMIWNVFADKCVWLTGCEESLEPHQQLGWYRAWGLHKVLSNSFWRTDCVIAECKF